jgi:hypothetical protein
MNRNRLQRLERAIAGGCPACAEWEHVVLVERLVIVSPGDVLEPLAPQSPPPQRCPRCGCDWSSRPRIVQEIRLEYAECLP